MSARERIKAEATEIGIVTLYFLACFLLFLGLKKLFLEEYSVSVTVFSTAVIGALVTAKVVVLLQKTSFGNRFHAGPILVHVLWRSLSYTAAVFLVTLAEHFIDFCRETGDLRSSLADLWKQRDFYHFLAMNLCIALSFLAYNTFDEIDQHLGRGSLRKLFLRRRASAA
jgi:hypothetical protein